MADGYVPRSKTVDGLREIVRLWPSRGNVEKLDQALLQQRISVKPVVKPAALPPVAVKTAAKTEAAE